uniref:BTB domain-containing protein n=1 Tax=Anopheles minimus TaxID=112268 RepID=A0A182WCZ6_9DIPT
MNPQQFSLKWNGYTSYVVGAFGSFRYEEDFVDVTLFCEGRKIRAHKILLSACSPYFKEVFKENPCQHPVIIFKNVRYADLLSLIEFMYHGEVNVLQDQLPSFLHTAEILAIRGLTDNASDNRQPASSNTSAIAQQLIQSHVLDKSTTLTTGDSLYLTLPTSMPIVHQPKLVQAQIPATPIITRPLIKSPPPEMPPLAKTSSVAMPIVQQQPTLVKMQVQQVQPTQQQYQQQTTSQVQSQPQNQTTQATTLQEVVENVVQSPKKRKIKVQHISTTQSAASVEPKVTVASTNSGKSGADEVYEADGYTITTTTDTQPEQEPYAENGQQSTEGSVTLKMEIPEFVSVDEPINPETFGLVTENVEEGREDEEIEIEGAEMEVSHIFQSSSDRTKPTVLQMTVERVEHGSDEKLHKCPECRRTFCSINAMKRHRQAKHLELPFSYECAMCDARFKTKWSLSTHKSKYHRGQNISGTSSGDARTEGTTKNTSLTQKRLITSTPLPSGKTRRLSSEDS